MKSIKYTENKLTVTRYVQNVHHWQKQALKRVGQCVINQRLLQALPHMQQTLPQIINVMNVTVTLYLRHI